MLAPGARPAAAWSALPRGCREPPWISHSPKTSGTCLSRSSARPASPGRPGRGRGAGLRARRGAWGERPPQEEALEGRAGGSRGWGFASGRRGAAAARGKRWAERAAGPGERRGDNGETQRDPRPWRWLPKLRAAPLRTRTPQGGNWAEDLGGDRCLPPQVCDQPQSYRLL